MHPCHSKFLVIKFILGFVKFQKMSTFGLQLHRPWAAKVKAEGEKPSTSAEDLRPLVDRCPELSIHPSMHPFCSMCLKSWSYSCSRITKCQCKSYLVSIRVKDMDT